MIGPKLRWLVLLVATAVVGPSLTNAGVAESSSPLIRIESRPMGSGPVLTGLDVLERENFARLAGKRVALLTHHAAIDRNGRHILDLMFHHPNVNLVTLFSPEHGLYGTVDTQTPDTLDTHTGLMVHSLYSERAGGQTKPFHPRQEDLKGLDVVVVDLQDIGARFYTYPAFMAYMMEECAKAGVEVIVLDRPNPIGGLYVDGPLADDDVVGDLTSYFKEPVAYGMTLGELARMFNEENKLGCKLTVVKMENWTRDMYFDQTGLRWVDPSPAIRDLDAALVYPGICILEPAISMGRGTTEPFHLFGAPFIDDPDEMVRVLNAAGMEGVRFERADYTPVNTRHIAAGQLCHGARMIVTDRRKFRPVPLGLYIMDYLQGKYGLDIVTGKDGKRALVFDVMRLRRFSGALVCARIHDHKSISKTLTLVTDDVARFLPIRARYLMYPESKTDGVPSSRN